MLTLMIIIVFLIVTYWRVYQKMGQPGWKSMIPVCNIWVMIKELYGSGWKIFIPIYGQLILLIGRHFKLAKRFHYPKSFGFGLWLLTPCFMILLAFSDSKYMDGSKRITGTDIFSCLGDRIDAWIRGKRASKCTEKDAISKLKELGGLYKNGKIDEETFKRRKEELLKQI